MFFGCCLFFVVCVGFSVLSLTYGVAWFGGCVVLICLFLLLFTWCVGVLLICLFVNLCLVRCVGVLRSLCCYFEAYSFCKLLTFGVVVVIQFWFRLSCSCGL